jgi:hypothetical protein
MATAEVRLKNLPQGREVEIPGLGMFKNGGGKQKVDDRRWERFVEQNPQYADSDHVAITTTGAREQTEALQHDEDLTKMKKDELAALADAKGIETKGKTKDDLVKELTNAS